MSGNEIVTPEEWARPAEAPKPYDKRAFNVSLMFGALIQKFVEDEIKAYAERHVIHPREIALTVYALPQRDNTLQIDLRGEQEGIPLIGCPVRRVEIALSMRGL